MPLPTPKPPPARHVRKEFICGNHTTITLDTFDQIAGMPEGGAVVALSFYTISGEWPGFTMCFPLENWKDFQREVADYDPQS